MSLLGREYRSLLDVPDDARDLGPVAPPRAVPAPGVSTRQSEQRHDASGHGEPVVAD